jgi:hypothetical protein
VLRDRALLRSLRGLQLLVERRERLPDLMRRRGDEIELFRRQLSVLADGRVADELANLLRVLGRDLRR